MGAEQLIDAYVEAFDWPKVKIVVKVLTQTSKGKKWTPHWLYQARMFVHTIQYRVEDMLTPGAYWVPREYIKANRKASIVMNTLTPDPLSQWV